jgi:hypothetical protein
MTGKICSSNRRATLTDESWGCDDELRDLDSSGGCQLQFTDPDSKWTQREIVLSRCKKRSLVGNDLQGKPGLLDPGST